MWVCPSVRLSVGPSIICSSVYLSDSAAKGNDLFTPYNKIFRASQTPCKKCLVRRFGLLGLRGQAWTPKKRTISISFHGFRHGIGVIPIRKWEDEAKIFVAEFSFLANSSIKPGRPKFWYFKDSKMVMVVSIGDSNLDQFGSSELRLFVVLPRFRAWSLSLLIYLKSNRQ